MFKIGEFAKLSGVTVKTLRHYDEIGLLKPARVDEESGEESRCALPQKVHWSPYIMAHGGMRQ